MNIVTANYTMNIINIITDTHTYNRKEEFVL